MKATTTTMPRAEVVSELERAAKEHREIRFDFLTSFTFGVPLFTVDDAHVAVRFRGGRSRDVVIDDIVRVVRIAEKRIL